MLQDTTNRLVKYYDMEKVDDEQIKAVDNRIRKLVKQDDRSLDEFYDAMINSYARFPLATHVYKILDKHPKLKIEQIENGIAKQTEWNHIQLFIPEFNNGRDCVLCGTPKNQTIALIFERDQSGYKISHFCPCTNSNSNPNLKLLAEWQAEFNRKKEEKRGLWDYSRWYEKRWLEEREEETPW